ncbi:hypothetical protein BHE74_00019349 [Ensete ventricosum]|nr:hypothetical protein GW17_00011405 [Ensete ventricosum]RWW72819.1 hypothetical protein BHE74_00019349 [Ensete ventricosum]
MSPKNRTTRCPTRGRRMVFWNTMFRRGSSGPGWLSARVAVFSGHEDSEEKGQPATVMPPAVVADHGQTPCRGGRPCQAPCKGGHPRPSRLQPRPPARGWLDDARASP